MKTMKWHRGGEGWERWTRWAWGWIWGRVLMMAVRYRGGDGDGGGGGGGDDCVHAWRTVVVSIWTCTEEKIKLIKQWQRLTLTPHWIIKHNLRVPRTRTGIPLNMFIGCRHDTQSTNYLPSTSNGWHTYIINQLANRTEPNLMFHSQCSHLFAFLFSTRNTRTLVHLEYECTSCRIAIVVQCTYCTIRSFIRWRIHWITKPFSVCPWVCLCVQFKLKPLNE